MSDDNSFGRGHHPLPARLAGLGRYCDALRPKNLLSHKVFVDDGVHMLTIEAGHGFSVMREDMKSLLRAGLVRMQSNEPGEISFYFEEKRR